MKICAMCGGKILKSMLPFQIMIPGANMKAVDSCGRCFLLTKISDHLKQANNPILEVPGGKPR